MKKTASIFLLFFAIIPVMSQEKTVQSLEKAYQSWVKAWNDLDANTVADFSWGNYGFGRDVPFVRSSSMDREKSKNGIQKYMDSMDVIEYDVYHSTFNIIDGVGLIDGFYAQTTKQKDGPLRTVYGRQSLVLTYQNDNWKIIHYHRSALPNEFTR